MRLAASSGLGYGAGCALAAVAMAAHAFRLQVWTQRLGLEITDVSHREISHMTSWTARIVTVTPPAPEPPPALPLRDPAGPDSEPGLPVSGIIHHDIRVIVQSWPHPGQRVIITVHDD
jgi:hypothetical protein